MKLAFSVCVIVLTADSAASAQHSSRTAIRVTAEVRPSCRIETSGSLTAPGSLTSTCRDIRRARISVDGRLLTPSNTVATSATSSREARVTLQPGSVVQIEF